MKLHLKPCVCVPLMAKSMRSAPTVCGNQGLQQWKLNIQTQAIMFRFVRSKATIYRAPSAVPMESNGGLRLCLWNKGYNHVTIRNSFQGQDITGYFAMHLTARVMLRFTIIKSVAGNTVR